MNRIIAAVSLGLCLSAALSSAALAECKAGNRNCVSASPTAPKACGKAPHYCTIDGGLGGTCKGGGSCGNAASGNIIVGGGRGSSASVGATMAQVHVVAFGRH